MAAKLRETGSRAKFGIGRLLLLTVGLCQAGGGEGG